MSVIWEELLPGKEVGCIRRWRGEVTEAGHSFFLRQYKDGSFSLRITPNADIEPLEGPTTVEEAKAVAVTLWRMQ